MTHPLEQFERRKAPNHVGELAASRQAFLAKEDQAQHEGKGECRVRQNAKRDVQRKNHAVRSRGRETILRRKVRGQKKGQNKWDGESSYRALPMVKLEAQVGERQHPAEQRHRAVEIVIGHSVQPARALEQRKIVRDQSETK